MRGCLARGVGDVELAANSRERDADAALASALLEPFGLDHAGQQRLSELGVPSFAAGSNGGDALRPQSQVSNAERERGRDVVPLAGISARGRVRGCHLAYQPIELRLGDRRAVHDRDRLRLRRGAVVPAAASSSHPEQQSRGARSHGGPAPGRTGAAWVDWRLRTILHVTSRSFAGRLGAGCDDVIRVADRLASVPSDELVPDAPVPLLYEQLLDAG